MQIIDNFLEEPYFKRLEKLLNMYEFPWFTRKDISEKGKFSGHIYYQIHTFSHPKLYLFDCNRQQVTLSLNLY